MKASELASSNFFKGLIYGDSGTGKTCFAASFPGPIEYWDFDNKISSAVSYFRRTDQVAKLNEIDVYQFGAMSREVKIAEWEKRSRAIDNFTRQNQELPFKTLVLDSLTTFTQAILDDYMLRSQKGLKRSPPDISSMQDYMLLDTHLTTILGGILSLKCNVVVLGHMGIEKDEASGVISRLPFMKGKFAVKLPIYFEEVYAAKVLNDGKRVLLTNPEGGYIARTQRGFAREIPMKVEEILK